MIESIELKNWKQFDSECFEFKPGFNVISGKNTTGKSTIMEALAFALHGSDAFPSIKKKELAGFKRDSARDASVTLRFKADDGRTLALERSVRSGGAAVQLRDETGREITSNPDEIHEHAGWLVHRDADFFKKSAFIGEGDIYTFFEKPHTSIMDHIDSLTRIGTFKKYKTLLVDLKKKKEKEFKAVQNKIKPKADDQAKGNSKEIEARIQEIDSNLSSMASKLDVICTEKQTVSETLNAFLDRARNLEESEKEMGRKASAEAEIVKIGDKIKELVPGASQSENVERMMKNSINKVENEKTTLSTEKEEYQGKASEKRLVVNQRQEQKKHLSSAGGTCPLCEQGLGEAHKTEILKKIIQDLENISHELPSIEAEIEERTRAIAQKNKCHGELLRLQSQLKQEITMRDSAMNTAREHLARGMFDNDFVSKHVKLLQGIIAVASIPPPEELINSLKIKLSEMEANKTNIQNTITSFRSEKEGLENALKVQETTLVREAEGLAHEEFLLGCMEKTFTKAVDDFRDTQLSAIKVLVTDYFKRFNHIPITFDWNDRKEPVITVNGVARPLHLLSESEKMELCLGIHLSLLKHASKARGLLIDEPFHTFSPENKKHLVELFDLVLGSDPVVDQVICTSLEPWTAIPKPNNPTSMAVHEISLK